MGGKINWNYTHLSPQFGLGLGNDDRLEDIRLPEHQYALEMQTLRRQPSIITLEHILPVEHHVTRVEGDTVCMKSTEAGGYLQTKSKDLFK